MARQERPNVKEKGQETEMEVRKTRTEGPSLRAVYETVTQERVGYVSRVLS